jgi:hypothetical protein
MKHILKLLMLTFVYSYSISFAQNEFKLITSVHGERNGDYFSSVDAVGDINGDGYEDFIVGGGGKYVKLYLGASPFDTLNCVKFLQGVRRRVYASGVGKGDLNGDGYNDFILNAPYDVNDYRVEIYFGGKELDTLPGLTITNNIWYSGFGARSITGDLNGDGYDDLVVSAPMDDYDAHGRLYIYFGGKEMDTVCDVFLEGKEPFDMFGGSVTIIGDINGDGYDDLLVGAPQVSEKNAHGKAYLFFGGNKIGFDNCVEFLGDSTTIYYGQKVAGLGDINGDGYKDFGVLSGNCIDIFSGKLLKKLCRVTSSEQFWSPLNIYGGFDVNKDGFNDFIFSYAQKENQYAGGVALYFGGSVLDTTLVIKLYGGTKNSYFGRYLSACDINNDGVTELLIGEEGELIPDGILGNGTVYIYTYGKPDDVQGSKESTLPLDYKLYPNFPNPFNPTTTVSYTLYKEQDITIEIFNSLGQRIKTLFSGSQQPGVYNIHWDAMDSNGTVLPSGIYFLRFSSVPVKGHKTKQHEVIKMVLIR